MEYNVHLNCMQVHMHKSKWCIQTDCILKVLHSRIQCSITDEHSIPHQQKQFHLPMKVMYFSLWSAWGLILWCSQCLSTRHLASFGTRPAIHHSGHLPSIFQLSSFKAQQYLKTCFPENVLAVAVNCTLELNCE